MSEVESLQNVRILIEQGTDKFESWIKENPEKACNILKAHYQLFLTEIIRNKIFEYEDEEEQKDRPCEECGANAGQMTDAAWEAMDKRCDLCREKNE